MCGICGTLSLKGGVADPDLVRDMTAALRHRGPDEAGLYINRQAGLGHARLSIIDIAGGHQPMHTADESLCITFNGEIFNYVELRDELERQGHRFRTRSDTEVILHLYQETGEACVERLNGQWAFAIWDVVRKKLFLSRDRFGVRPLFYTRTDSEFLFASEIKALLVCPEVRCALDPQALDQILTFWVTLPPRTAFQDIRQLPPGHLLVLENGRIRTAPYWSLEYPDEPGSIAEPEEAMAERLLALLRDAVRIRLRADVPVGSYLSGGLDSALVTALAKTLAGDRLRTFSVSFAEKDFDEGSHQQEASRYLQTEHSGIRSTSAQIGRVFPEVVWHAEQPLLRTAPAPLFALSQLVSDSGFKVVLTGEGADEMLGGYDIFKEAKIRRFWARDPGSPRRPLLLRRLYPYIDDIRKQPRAYLEKFFCVAPEDVASPFFSHLPRWRLTARLKSLLSDQIRAEVRTGTALLELEQVLPGSFFRWPPFHQAEYLEAMYLLPGYILSSQGDRMAMAHAVEARYPYLDHRVVEFAAQLPAELKMKVLDQKYLLKRAARGWIPESIRLREKQPYRAPDASSFIDPGLDYVEELLAPARLRRDGIFAPQAVERLASKVTSGRASSAADNMALVAILSTGLLLEQFVNRRERPQTSARVSETSFGTINAYADHLN